MRVNGLDVHVELDGVGTPLLLSARLHRQR